MCLARTTERSPRLPSYLLDARGSPARALIANRWLRFNLVGILGAALQLATLWTLSRLLPRHYLLATAVALEITLLHNVTWHLLYTWRDRMQPDAPKPPSHPAWWSLPLGEVARFHLTNGAVSLAGNLALMRLLVHNAHMPVVASNALAILTCSLLNYKLSDKWVFAPGSAVVRR